jgi:hypothetical protein
VHRCRPRSFRAVVTVAPKLPQSNICGICTFDNKAAARVCDMCCSALAPASASPSSNQPSVALEPHVSPDVEQLQNRIVQIQSTPSSQAALLPPAPPFYSEISTPSSPTALPPPPYSEMPLPAPPSYSDIFPGRQQLPPPSPPAHLHMRSHVTFDMCV